jgi:AcrR family transcriptional regulator
VQVGGNMITQVNPNDPRVKRTRQLLQQAFIDLVREQSFEAISVQDIAARATLNRATFYAHFADKYALLDATIGASFADALLKRVPADAALCEEDTIRRLILTVCDFHLDLSSQCKRSFQALESFMEPRIIAHLQGSVQACLARKETTHKAATDRLEVVATAVSWSIYGVVLRWDRTGRLQSPESLVEIVLPIIMGSIAALDR